MTDATEEPTWGADVQTPGPRQDHHRAAQLGAAGHPTGQISLPVVAPKTPAQTAMPPIGAPGFRPTSAPPPAVAPRSGWSRPTPMPQYPSPGVMPQYAQPVYDYPSVPPPFVAPAPPAQYVAPPPVQYVAPPSAVSPHQPPALGVPSPYPTYGQPPARDTFVTRLVQRGIRGELFRQPWFHNVRATQPEGFVYAGYGVAVALTVLMAVVPSGFFATAFTAVGWGALAYLYFAMGTKLAHQFLLWGICVAGGVVMLLRLVSTFSLLAFDGGVGRLTGRYVEPSALLVLNLLLEVGLCGLLGFVGVQLHREMGKLSRP